MPVGLVRNWATAAFLDNKLDEALFWSLLAVWIRQLEFELDDHLRDIPLVSPLNPLHLALMPKIHPFHVAVPVRAPEWPFIYVTAPKCALTPQNADANTARLPNRTLIFGRWKPVFWVSSVCYVMGRGFQRRNLAQTRAGERLSVTSKTSRKDPHATKKQPTTALRIPIREGGIKSSSNGIRYVR